MKRHVVVGFILPPLFDSDGKGAPGKRITGYLPAHTEKLPDDSFECPDGREVSVASIFQVWAQVGTEKKKRQQTKPAPITSGFIPCLMAGRQHLQETRKCFTSAMLICPLPASMVCVCIAIMRGYPIGEDTGW